MSADGWFRRLLRLLPADFRDDYAREMSQVFREQRRDAAAEGRLSLLGLWGRTLAELLAIGPREHLAQLRQDVSYAIRGMAREPVFIGVAITALALGIGANSAIFGLTHAVLLRPLPYRDPGRLVALWNRWDGTDRARLSNPEYLDYAERSRSLDLAGAAEGAANVGVGATAERVAAAYVTANALDVLGVRPEIGRAFRPEEGRPGAANVVVLSHRYWKARFGGDPGVLGKTLPIDGVPCEIVGVMPAGFLTPVDFGADRTAEILQPLEMDPSAPRNRRGGHYLRAFGRLKAGATLTTARSDMGGILGALIRAYPDQHDQGHFSLFLAPLRTDLLGDARPILRILSAAVGLVLLVACANVASLLLARGQARRREMALRTALGASRLRIVRQLVTEALVLAMSGAVAGLAVAMACQRLILALAPHALPRSGDLALGLPVVLASTTLGVVTALVFGLVPAFRLSRRHAGPDLREGGRETGHGGLALRRALVVAQLAMAVVLLVAAGLLVKSFAHLMEVPRGFDGERVLTFRVSLPPARYPERGAVVSYLDRLRERLATLPDVRSVGASTGLPLAFSSGDWSFDAEGRPRVDGRHTGAADWYVVTPGYFETLGIRLVRGRRPDAGDSAESSPVVFLNETAARAFFPGDDAVGRRVRFTRTTGPEQPWRTIAGVVGDVRQNGLERAPRPEVYFPETQFVHFLAGGQAWDASLVLKTTSRPEAAASAVQSVVREVDPEVPAAQVLAMGSVVADSLRDRRLNLALIAAFGVLALVLSLAGLYGLLAYGVARRTRELGVRVAIGASRGAVMGLVLGEGLRLVGAGVALGTLLASALSASLAPFLYDVTPRDAAVYAAIPLLFAAAALPACAVPARRALQVDPIVALRAE